MFEAIMGLIVLAAAALMFSLAVKDISDREPSDN